MNVVPGQLDAFWMPRSSANCTAFSASCRPCRVEASALGRRRCALRHIDAGSACRRSASTCSALLPPGPPQARHAPVGSIDRIVPHVVESSSRESRRCRSHDHSAGSAFQQSQQMIVKHSRRFLSEKLPFRSVRRRARSRLGDTKRHAGPRRHAHAVIRKVNR